MKSKEKQLRDSRLYLILDKGSLKYRNPGDVAKEALEGGVDILQIRDKSSQPDDIIKYGREVKRTLKSSPVLLIVNDSVDICKALDADGVHLGQDDLSLKEARAFLGKNKIIGISCHSLKEAKEAARGGADYIAVGPIFKSPTKPELEARGTTVLSDVRKGVKAPLVAIGGINERNVGSVLRCGADIVAVTNAILKKGNIKSASCNLKKVIK